VISDVANPFFTDIVRGCEDVAQQQGYSLVLANTDESPSREASVLGLMGSERAAGVVVASTNQAGDSLHKLQSMGIPIVAIDRRIDRIDTDLVGVDNETAAFEAIEHLTSLGHTSIAMITGPDSVSSTRERLRGFQRALREYGIPDSASTVLNGNLRESGGYESTMELLGLAEPPTAIFSANNLTTLGCLRALRERKVRVPQVMSLVGFDDFPLAELLDPPITIVRQPTYQLGARAISALIDRIRDPFSPVREVLLSAHLVVRGSTAAPRRNGIDDS
jgi:DNA-binding LacI/PurR family transcriptional regulator